MEIALTVTPWSACPLRELMGRGVCLGRLNVENDPRTPQPVLLPDLEIVVSHAFDRGVKIMAVQIELLPGKATFDSLFSDLVDRATLGDKCGDVESREQLAYQAWSSSSDPWPVAQTRTSSLISIC